MYQIQKSQLNFIYHLGLQLCKLQKMSKKNNFSFWNSNIQVQRSKSIKSSLNGAVLDMIWLKTKNYKCKTKTSLVKDWRK